MGPHMFEFTLVTNSSHNHPQGLPLIFQPTHSADQAQCVSTLNFRGPRGQWCRQLDVRPQIAASVRWSWTVEKTFCMCQPGPYKTPFVCSFSIWVTGLKRLTLPHSSLCYTSGWVDLWCVGVPIFFAISGKWVWDDHKTPHFIASSPISFAFLHNFVDVHVQDALCQFPALRWMSESPLSIPQYPLYSPGCTCVLTVSPAPPPR